MKSVSEFLDLWNRNKNCRGAEDCENFVVVDSGRGDRNDAAPKRSTASGSAGPSIDGSVADDEDAEPGTPAGRSAADATDATTLVPRRTPQPIEGLFDVDGEGDTLSRIVDADGDELEASDDHLGHYKTYLHPEYIMQNGVDGRTRAGALKLLRNSKDDNLKRELEKIIKEADRAEELISANVPDMSADRLLDIAKRFKALELKIPLKVALVLLARQVQDIIVSNKWARLVSVLDLLHEGKFDPTSPSVGSLPCPLARKVKVFSHLVFRGFLPETLAKGEALTARLVELFSSFQNHYANVDLVDGPEPITAELGTWSSIWVGTPSIAVVDFQHEAAEEPTSDQWPRRGHKTISNCIYVMHKYECQVRNIT